MPKQRTSQQVAHATATKYILHAFDHNDLPDEKLGRKAK